MNSQLSTLNSQPSFSSRLVRLCDGRLGLRNGLQMEVREPSLADAPRSTLDAPRAADPQPSTLNAQPAEQPILDFYSSDETVDRYHEVIRASGWRLESYRRNPVFQNAHNYGDIIFTLGKALVTEVRTGAPPA